ncbi:MAG: hypothetical protein VX453_00175 [Acidobacteriota bacterium]|nr:hypothetical protein [Acidobacteriota bacterium]
MLRSLVAVAPLIAAIMVVVLLVEPPALTPADRIPALRVLTRPSLRLDPKTIQEAIARGALGQPPSYVLQRVQASSDRGSPTEAAGLVYTPALRIAWAAYRRQQEGHPLSVAEVPLWMTSPVVYVALRSPAGAAERPSLAVLPTGLPTCCRLPQPTLAKPIWVSTNAEPLARFGAPVPFPDLSIVAAYPIAILEPGVDIVAFHRIDSATGPASAEMRGRLRHADLVDWR